MTPTIGRIVLFSSNNSEAEEYPAIITHVHGDKYVNLRVFHDAPPDSRDWLTSVPLNEAEDGALSPFTWRWPPKV